MLLLVVTLSLGAFLLFNLIRLLDLKLDISLGGLIGWQLLNLIVVLFLDHFLDISAADARGFKVPGVPRSEVGLDVEQVALVVVALRALAI